MSAAAPDSSQYRLPTNVKATHYDIIIKTDLENLTFNGIAKVSLDINTETSTIVLNTSDLELGKATLYSETLKAEQVATFSSFHQTQERAVYQLNDPLPAGSKAELKIVYAGKLTGSMMGYYKSAWENKGKTEHYALTQFEPTAARRAFPCWDEPLLKSTYAITMISRANTVNLNNMPVETEELIDQVDVPDDLTDILASTKNDSDKWKITRFQTTPLMSSYLVAFANGPFEFLETSVVMPLSGKTVPLRIYTTPDVIHQAQFALDVKATVLPLYEKIFNVEYPLPKLDTLVASDFDAGAMENWGLITGRTNAFLLDPKRADLKAKVDVVATQSHEVAHMWFGNITTMEWWNYLYLNEGFATLMGEVIIPVYPDWKVNSSFINEHLSYALGLDAKPSSHPIEVDCPDANHINQIFDALSYSKAASVLRMLSNYVGEEKFLKGVSLYLKDNLFANTITNDLWKGISTATGLDITQLMENWINKIGFPVVTVTEHENGITVRQDRFLDTGPADPKDNETIWNIPLSLLSTKDGKSSIDMTTVLQEREKTISLDTSQPFKLNAGTIGVYRVLYTPDRLVLIAKEAAREGSVLSLNDRLGLLNDTMALSKAGLAKLSSALTLIDLWRGEKEYLVWQGIGHGLSNLISIWWEHPKIVDKLNMFRRALFVPLVEKLGYEYSESDSRDTSLLRTLAVEQAAVARDQGVAKELKGRFKYYIETGDSSKVPADLQRAVFATAVREGGREEYDAVISLHDKPKTPTEKMAAIMAMSASEDPELLQETFDFLSNKTRDQDLVYFFSGISRNLRGRRLLTKYFQDNYDVLTKRFEGNFSFHHLISLSSEYYASEADLEMIKTFYKDKDTSKYNLALEQALDGIRSKISYVSRSTDDLWAWESSLSSHDHSRE